MPIEDGQELVLCTRPGVKDTVEVRYETFAEDVKPGEEVLIDDGNLKLQVLKTDGKSKVVLKVIHGGILKSRKGINLPTTLISQPSMTPKDKEDLEFAIEHEFDWIALSFVRTGRDIIELKHIIRSKESSSRVIAKMEKPEAIENMEAIIAESDGVMVARGDLGVEIPMAEVPLVQKKIIDRCRSYGRPVIVATQMMESMITNIQPTRAEVNDVANAVLDGTDAVMLSAETSVGRFPVQVVQAMTSIIQRMEDHGPIYFRETESAIQDPSRMVSDAICETSTKLSKTAEAQGIVTMTHSGYTALKISSYRPKGRIFVFTGNRSLLAQMSLVWGVRAYYYDKMVSTDHTIADIKYLLKQEGIVQEGDLLINIASMPISEQGMTNMMKLSRVR
jgi:pyruvate kinase